MRNRSGRLSHGESDGVAPPRQNDAASGAGVTPATKFFRRETRLARRRFVEKNCSSLDSAQLDDGEY